MSLCAQALTVIALIFVATSSPANAQWSGDTANNQLVSGSPSDQNQVKVEPAKDGGFWVSWLDGVGTGWDVRLQKYDVRGNELFPSGGLLVADRGFSSTQDYGLAVAHDGDALLAFRDDRSGSVEITAARVSSTGSLQWGAPGIPLTSSAGFVASPKIVPGTGRGATVAWTENATVRVQWLNEQGTPGWGAGVTLTPTFGSYLLADMHWHSEDTILSLVHQTGGFSAPRHLLAQRINRFGAAVWGSPVPVLDSGSLQIGNFPSFTVGPDGHSIFSWYTSSPTLQCYVQRLTYAGSEVWPHNGVPVATTPGVVRVNPYATRDLASDDVIVAWREQDPGQSMSGISAQRVNASGQRLWTDAGTTLAPVGASGTDFATVTADAPSNEILFTWEESPSFATDRVYAARVDAGGSVTVPRYDVASTASAKNRYSTARGVTGTVAIAWSDQRNDGGDIYLQAFTPNGEPGDVNVVSTETCAGVVNSTGSSATLFAVGSDVASANDVRLWTSRLPISTFAFYLTSMTPGFVAGPGGSAGDLCLGGSIGRYVGPGQIQSSGFTEVISLPLDLTQHPTPTGLITVVAGQRWYFQCWYRDVTTTTNSNFSSAVAIDFL